MLDESLFRGKRLAVVGNICRDVKTGGIPANRNLLEDGETAAAFIAETVGGGGANSALAAAGLGAEVSFSGKIGTDLLGKRLEHTLRRYGVKPCLSRDSGVKTGTSVVLSYRNGSRHFISSQPNNYSLEYGDIDLSILAEADHLLRADVWFSGGMLNGGNEELFQAARSLGVPTSLDINWDPLWGSDRQDTIAGRKKSVQRLLPLADLVHGNARELNCFAGSGDLDTTLRKITSWGAGALIVHLGAGGSGYYCDGRLTVCPAVPVECARNTTGTGDILSVCMILLHNLPEIPILKRLHLANTIVSEFIEGKRNLSPEID